MVYSGDPMAADGSSLVSFNRKAASMAIQKTNSRNEEELIEEDEVPLVIFTGWLDKILKTNTLMGPDFRSRDIKKRVAPQKVSHVFPISIPAAAINETGWGVPEKVSLRTTAELNCEIYQLHSFADNASFTGDFYAVEADLTIHNANLNNGRWQYTQGGKKYESAGFFLSECGLGVSLYEKGASGLMHSGTHTFAGGPAPASVDPASTFQSGFEWKFDGWLSGGNGLESATPIPIQEGGWTWNNLKENDPSGFGVEVMADGGDALWTLTSSGSDDLTFHCSWIWAVPQAADDSTDRYYMQVNLNPVYSLTRSILSGSRTESKDLPAEVPTGCFMLIPPSRAEGQRI